MGENGNSADFIFLGSKITADGDCSHEIKRRLLLGRKAMTNLDSVLKSRDITLLAKVRLVKAMVFPVFMYGCESWTIKKAEHWRIAAFELWCWRRLLKAPWAARRSSQSNLKEISPEYSLKGLMLKLKLQYFGHLMWRADSLEKTLMLRKIEGRRRRGWQDEMVGCHHGLDGHEFEQVLGVDDGQGSWYASVHGVAESDMTERLNWTDHISGMILVFWMLHFKPDFSLSSFTFIKRLFSSFSLSAIRMDVVVKLLSHIQLFHDPMDCKLPGSSVHGIFQARILEWVAISFSRISSWPRNQTLVSCLASRFFTTKPSGKPH